MPLYIIPEGVENKELTDTLDRFGAPLIRASKLRDLILETQGAPLAVASVKVSDLMVLNRHASTLLEEVPTVVLSIPGALYTSEWMTVASALPAIDWIELSKKLQKSGHTAHEPSQLSSRSNGVERIQLPIPGEEDTHSRKGFFGRRHQALPTSPLDETPGDGVPSRGEDDA